MHLEHKMTKRDKLKEESSLLEKHEESLTSRSAVHKEGQQEKRERLKEKSAYIDRHVS